MTNNMKVIIHLRYKISKDFTAEKHAIPKIPQHEGGRFIIILIY